MELTKNQKNYRRNRGMYLRKATEYTKKKDEFSKFPISVKRKVIGDKYVKNKGN